VFDICEPLKRDLSDAPCVFDRSSFAVSDMAKIVNRTYIELMKVSPADMAARKVRRDGELIDGRLAMAEYLAEPEQRAANTAKQREARLAHEAAVARLPPVAKSKKKPTAETTVRVAARRS
jgi:hypothetical protein